MKPEGHGFNVPALQKAEELLNLNNYGSCALSLMFFSDGKPSDFFQDGDKFNFRKYLKVEKGLTKTCGMLASRFGRRLTVTCIGMAEAGANFTTLEKMSQEAKEFGATATFHRPSLNTDSLSQIISSSVASSLSSRTELASLQYSDANKQVTTTTRSVRMDIEREKQDTPNSKNPNPNEWRIFRDSLNRSVIRIWTWSALHNDFAAIIDHRCHECSKPVADVNYNILHTCKGGARCNLCKSCFFCGDCVEMGVLCRHQLLECEEYLNDRRHGFLVGSNHIIQQAKIADDMTATLPATYDVAWKKKAFGEGAERLAFKFRFLDPVANKFVGPVMVAKESRFVEDLMNDDNKQQKHQGNNGRPMQSQPENYLCSLRHSYHRTFMRTQSIASKFAARFNERLEKLLPSDALVHVPKIEFVKPLVF